MGNGSGAGEGGDWELVEGGKVCEAGLGLKLNLQIELDQLTEGSGELMSGEGGVSTGDLNCQGPKLCSVVAHGTVSQPQVV